jgi:tRNA modification GTPase
MVITRERHFAALGRASASLDLALEAIAASHPPEVIAVDLTATLGELGEVVGLSTSEEILDRVFREFCIGK